MDVAGWEVNVDTNLQQAVTLKDLLWEPYRRTHGGLESGGAEEDGQPQHRGDQGLVEAQPCKVVVTLPQAFPHHDVSKAPGEAERVSGHSLSHTTQRPHVTCQIAVDEVDDGGDEESPQECEDVSEA